MNVSRHATHGERTGEGARVVPLRRPGTQPVMPVRRRPRALPALAGVLVVLLMVQLGTWQLRRAAEKSALQVQIESALASAPAALAPGRDAADWQRVRLVGTWRPEATIYLDNRVHHGRPGYHVLTPLERADGGWALVNRGWVEAGRLREALPQVVTQAGPVEIEGIARYPQPGGFTLAARPVEGRLWQYLDLDVYRQSSGLPVADWLVQQGGEASDGLVREWPRPDTGVDRHKGYALQWFSLGALGLALTALYVYRSFRRDDA